MSDDDADDPQAGDPQEQFDALPDNEKLDHLERQADEDESHGKHADPGGHTADRGKIANEVLGPISSAVSQLNDLQNLVRGLEGDDRIKDPAEQKQIHGLVSAADQALQSAIAAAGSALSEAQTAGVYASAIEMAQSSLRKAHSDLTGANTHDASAAYGSYKQAWSDASSAHTSIESFRDAG